MCSDANLEHANMFDNSQSNLQSLTMEEGHKKELDVMKFSNNDVNFEFAYYCHQNHSSCS